MKRILYTMIALLTFTAANAQEFGKPQQAFPNASGIQFTAPAAASQAANVSLNAPSKAEQDDNGIIYDVPAGTRVDCMTHYQSWFVSWGSLFGMPCEGKPTHYIVDDNYLYLYNPIITDIFGPNFIESYIKGEKTEDGRYLFTLPQPIYTEEVDGVEVLYYLNSLVINDEGSYIIAEDNSVTFAIREDGSVELDPAINVDDNDATRCIGATDIDGKWNGFGNTRMTYQKLNYTEPTPPGSDVEINTWTFSYCDIVYDSEGQQQYGETFNTKDVNIGIKGNEIWIQGLGDFYLPDAWAHGTFDGTTVTLDTYLGISDVVGQCSFLLGNNYLELGSPIVAPTFTYYPETATLVCNSDIVLNPNDWFIYSLKVYGQPSFQGDPAGVNKIGNDESIATVKWFDMMGREVDNPTDGIFIRQTKYSSGKQVVTKECR